MQLERRFYVMGKNQYEDEKPYYGQKHQLGNPWYIKYLFRKAKRTLSSTNGNKYPPISIKVFRQQSKFQTEYIYKIHGTDNVILWKQSKNTNKVRAVEKFWNPSELVSYFQWNNIYKETYFSYLKCFRNWKEETTF